MRSVVFSSESVDKHTVNSNETLLDLLPGETVANGRVVQGHD